MKKRKIISSLVVIVAILAVSSVVMDWLALFRCGAVEQCLSDCSGYQRMAKFAIIVAMTVVVFLIGDCENCPRDRKLLQAGFVFALCAEYCMKVLDDAALFGICLFMVVQTLFIFRHTRASDFDRHFPRILYIPFGMMILVAVLFLVEVLKSPKLSIVVAYGMFVICSLIVACRASKKGYFPTRNAKFIKWGMILFFCCDVCVGISGVVAEDYSVQKIFTTVAHNLVWMFYAPSLVLLGLSGYDFSKGEPRSLHPLVKDTTSNST